MPIFQTGQLAPLGQEKVVRFSGRYNSLIPLKEQQIRENR